MTSARLLFYGVVALLMMWAVWGILPEVIRLVELAVQLMELGLLCLVTGLIVSVLNAVQGLVSSLD